MKLCRLISLLTLTLLSTSSARADIASALAQAHDLRTGERVDAPAKAYVFIVAGVSCPLSNLYRSRVAQYAGKYKDAGIKFFLLYANGGESETDVRKATNKNDLQNVQVVYDPEQRIANELKADTLSQTFVLNERFEVVYSGGFDDQFSLQQPGVGLVTRSKVSRPYVAEALDYVLDPQMHPKPESTAAVGCVLNVPEPTSRVSSHLTYWKDVQPIFKAKCVGCHQPGGVMSKLPLTDPDSFSHMLPTIKSRVKHRIMPPWGAEAGDYAFSNDPTLSDEEIRTVVSWIDQKAPPGIPTAEQEAWVNSLELDEIVLQYKEKSQKLLAKPSPNLELTKLHQEIDSQPQNWYLHETPDVVVHYPEPINISASQYMDYFYGDGMAEQKVYTLDEDRCVEWAEFKTDAPEQLHHAIAVAHMPKGEGFWLESRSFAQKEIEDHPTDGLLGIPAILAKRLYQLNPLNLEKVYQIYGMTGTRAMSVVSAFVPGRPVVSYPLEFGSCLPKGSSIYMEIHFTPSGEARLDRPRLGIKWKPKKPQHELYTLAFGRAGEQVRIPPMTPDHTLEKEFTFEKRAVILILSPHAHLRGSKFKYELISPRGEKRMLLDIPRFDFKNQPYYVFKTPLEVEAGTTIKVTAVYNNYSNPKNPKDPLNNPNVSPEQAAKWVNYGLQTEEEMFWGYVSFAYLEDFTRYH